MDETAFLVIHPVDKSKNFKKLCEACRRGDVKTVQYLIQFGNVNLNAVNEFDYHPLTLASLCGHYDVVELLLESGSLCERDTFQGERCWYSALNDRIRNLLLKYNYSKSIDQKQPFASHLSSLLLLRPLDTSDITISTTYHGTPLLNSTETPTYTKEFRLHKFYLSARSHYFRKKLQPSDVPKKSPKHLRLPSSIDAKAFESTVKFLYCGEITELFSPKVIANINELLSHMDLPALWDFVMASHDSKQRRQRRMEEVDKAQEELYVWCRQNVLEKAIRVDKEKASDFRMEQNNSTFADIVFQADEEEEDRPEDASNDWEPKAVFYPVHKAMLRSEFFITMFTSGFKEGRKYSSSDEPLQVLFLDIAPAILEIILVFLYTDKAEIPLELALDTLYAADQLLIERLKTKAATVISIQGNAGLPSDKEKEENPDKHDDDIVGYNIYDVIRAGWATRVQRLEEFGAKYIAERLEDYLEHPNFAKLVLESARRIKRRQETDTIELIDDIRYFLDGRFRMRMEDLNVEEMYDESAAASAPQPSEASAEGVKNIMDGTTKGEDELAKQKDELPEPERWTKEELEADFMRIELIKFNELCENINGLLARLNLDA